MEDDEEELEAPSLSASEVLDLHRGLRSALQLKAGTTKEQQRRASLGLDFPTGLEDAARGGARQPMRRVAKEPANRKAAPSKAVPRAAHKAKYVEVSDEEEEDDEDEDEDEEEDYVPAKKAASVTASKGRQPRGPRVDENAALLNVAPVS